MLNIVLVEPLIPQNTGNIARTCAAIGASLHIIKPIPFEISDKTVKRAGLDYWQYLDIKIYESLDNFLDMYKGNVFFFVETGSNLLYTEVEYKQDCFIFFGKETKGLSKELLQSGLGTVVTIPTLDYIRSLNLSNAVAIVAYEAIRQNEGINYKF